MTRLTLALVLAIALSGCGAAITTTQTTHTVQPIASIPLGVAEDHFHTVSVRVTNLAPVSETDATPRRVVTTFILDTGIGISLVSQSLCERIQCALTGEFVGQRMSGQAVRVPTARVATLELGEYVQHDVLVGVVDIDGFFPEPAIEGFLGLPFFAESAVTIDPFARQLIVESEDSLAARLANGNAIPVRLSVQGPAIDAFVQATLPHDQHAEMLLDTGSRGLTLHTRYAEGLGIDLSTVRTQQGQDETGHAYTRYFTTLDTLSLVDAPESTRPTLRVMFQEIIHDGLIGTDYLSSFIATFDVAHARVILQSPH